MQIIVSSATGDGLLYQLNTLPQLTIEDQIGTNDGELSFPLPSSTQLIAITGPLTPTGSGTTATPDVSVPDIVDPVNPSNPTTAEIFNNPIPLNELFIALSDISGGDVPPIMFWVILATIVILASGMYTFAFTASVPWTAAVMAMFTLGSVNFGGGIIPFWVFYFFGVMAASAATYIKVKAI
jgi:hypothetical protein